MRELLTDALAALERGEPHYRNAVTRLRAAVEDADAVREQFVRLNEASEPIFETALLSARGYSDRECAEARGVAQNTICANRRKAFKQLGIDSTAQLAVMAFRAGLLGDGEP